MRVDDLLEIVNLCAGKQAIMGECFSAHSRVSLGQRGQNAFSLSQEETCPRLSGEDTEIPVSLMTTNATQAFILKLTQCASSLSKTEQQRLSRFCMNY